MVGATNESKFSAYPSGSRDLLGNYVAQGYAAEWWSSTENENNGEIYYARIQSGDDNLSLFDQAKHRGKAIRCLKD